MEFVGFHDVVADCNRQRHFATCTAAKHSKEGSFLSLELKREVLDVLGVEVEDGPHHVHAVHLLQASNQVAFDVARCFAMEASMSLDIFALVFSKSSMA